MGRLIGFACLLLLMSASKCVNQPSSDLAASTTCKTVLDCYNGGGSGGVCVSGTCQQLACGADADCAAGGAVGTVCTNGQCTPCAYSYQCPIGQLCNAADGLCTTCTSYRQCARGQVCSDGNQQAHTACSKASPCLSGDSCIDGFCQQSQSLECRQCSQYAPCPSGYSCENGSCVLPALTQGGCTTEIPLPNGGWQDMANLCPSGPVPYGLGVSHLQRYWYCPGVAAGFDSKGNAHYSCPSTFVGQNNQDLPAVEKFFGALLGPMLGSAPLGLLGFVQGSCGCCPFDKVACYQSTSSGQVPGPARCVDTGNDNNNCGACGNVCPNGTICLQGKCISPCDNTMREATSTTLFCNESHMCVDVMTDEFNCGNCGNKCGSAQYCALGVCTDWCDPNTQNYCGGSTCCSKNATCCGGTCCPAGGTCCGGLCFDLTGPDPSNCGACGKACSATQICQTQGLAGANPPAQCCNASNPNEILEVCGDKCVNVIADPNNCGACGNQCTSTQSCLPQANAAYTNGPFAMCCPNSSDDGVILLCGGGCSNILEDVNNCGNCGVQCNATSEVCKVNYCTSDSECPGVSKPGESKCVSDPAGYQCVSNQCVPCTQTTCSENSSCPSPQLCIGGKCVAPPAWCVDGNSPQCPQIQRNGNQCCSGNLIHCGSECVDIHSNSSYCGSCSTACPSSHPTCRDVNGTPSCV